MIDIKPRLFAPDGQWVDALCCMSWASPQIEVIDAGSVEPGDWFDTPSANPWEPLNRVTVRSYDGADWMLDHCRLVLWDDTPDQLDLSDVCLPEWPDEVVKACKRVEQLSSGLQLMIDAHYVLPDDYKDDLMAQIFDKFWRNRIHDEIHRLETEIARFRMTDRVPTYAELELAQEQEETNV